MKTFTKLLLPALLALLVAGPVLGKGDKEKKEAEATKKFLKGVGKLFLAKDASGIAAYFPDKGKVELSLAGVRADRYRKKQAKAVLSDYFGRIEPKEYKLAEVRGSVGRFTMKYVKKADKTQVSGTTWVYFKKEDDRWTITGIVES